MTSHATPPPPDQFTRYADRFTAEKLENLRLIRALDGLTIEPALALRTERALLRFEDFDRLVTTTLVALERSPGEPAPAPSLPLEQLLFLGPSTRAEVREGLPPPMAAALGTALSRLRLGPADVWDAIDEADARDRKANPREATRTACRCGSGAPQDRCCGDRMSPEERRDFDVGLSKLAHRWAAFELEAAFVRAFDRFQGWVPDDDGSELIGPWLVYHATFEGKPLVEHFLPTQPTLTPTAKRWLEANARTPLSICTVDDVVPRRSFRLHDLLTGAVHAIADRRLSVTLRPGRAICVRVAAYREERIVAGFHGHTLPDSEARRVAAHLLDARLGATRAPEARLDPAVIAGRGAKPVLEAWVDAVALDRRRPAEPGSDLRA
ncbi:MAG: hypothetical protein JNM10_03590 [Planctomycetia bacterium]|nr:hypothetical protein [Planctomycetia bacterium]